MRTAGVCPPRLWRSRRATFASSGRPTGPSPVRENPPPPANVWALLLPCRQPLAAGPGLWYDPAASRGAVAGWFLRGAWMMFVVTIEPEECDGCGQCADSCPSQIISMVEGKAEVTGDSAECLGCESCVIVCASGVVKVEEF